MSHVSRPASPFSSLVSCPLVALSLHAGEPGFSFSGQLLETSDNVSTVAEVDGKTHYTASLYLRLYDDSDGEKGDKSQALWGRCVPVSVEDGYFSCDLCDSAGTPIAGLPCTQLADAFKRLSGAKFSVGVTPFDDANAEITPRQTLTSVPYAVCATDALGSIGDLAVPGTLNAAGFKANEAVFNGPVTHEGPVTLASRQTLAKLVLDDRRTLDLADVAAEAAALTNATVRSLAAGTVTAAVGEVGELVATNLAFGGAVTLGTVTPPAGSAALTVNGDVGSSVITAQVIEAKSPLPLFQFNDGFSTLPGRTGAEASETWYTVGDNECYWTAPESWGNVFVSLSFCLAEGASVCVSVGGTPVATLALQKTSGSVWLPFQTFVKAGQKISWTGMSVTDSVLMTVRKFSY